MTFEIILMLLAPYPHLQEFTYTEYVQTYDVYINYRINDMLLCASFIRAYLLVRCALVISPFMTPRSKRVCFMNNCEANLTFAVKAYMKQSPYTAILISLIGTIVMFGYTLKIFEGPLSEVSK